MDTIYLKRKIDEFLLNWKNSLNKKYSKNLKPFIERKDKISAEESMLRVTRIEKKKELAHLKVERDSRYKELLEVMEDEVKLSNSEIEGQLEIPGMRRIKNR